MSFGIGWDGAIYAAARRSQEPVTEERGLGIFPKSKLSKCTDYLVLRWTPEGVRTLVHRAEALVVSFVQPFLEGVLPVGARCHWRSGGTEKNAVALDWEGREQGRFVLGDGIQDLRVTRDRGIWASYSMRASSGAAGAALSLRPWERPDFWRSRRLASRRLGQRPNQPCLKSGHYPQAATSPEHKRNNADAPG